MTAPEPARTPAEIAVHTAAMSQQLMDQLELYAKDLQALHTQRSLLRVEVRRAQRQAASAEREQDRLREQLQERLQQPPPLPPPVEAAPRVLAAPRPGARAPKPTAWRRLAQHLPAVVGTGVTVAGLALATGIGVGSPAVPADPVNGPAAVATQVALVTRVALVTQVVPTDARPGASPTSAAAVAATRPYGAAASPTPAGGGEPSAAGTPTAGPPA
ncbi:MAG TPA: hypothetical protein VG370_04750, partial [Chloroflexota bacterium]|nr:hypothetical protein [Chloroflexota bacterium]